MRLYAKHTKHLVAVDCIIFGYDILEKVLKLLLIKRSFDPEKGKWSLAGGFVESDESLDEAANRILFRLTGLEQIFMKQSFSYGAIDRDPGARVISTAYFALITIRDINKELTMKNGAHWRSISNLPDLIFDHHKMVSKALSDLQSQVAMHPVGFELLPDKFTMVQLQNLYEAIYQRKIDKRNFRKKVLSMDILEKLEEKEKETSKKGAFYYKFIKEKYEMFKQNGLFFNIDVN